MKISVITPIYNRPEHLRLSLAALRAQTRRPDEIVVSDDGSDPACAEEIRRHLDACGIPAKYVRQDHDGFRAAAARNLAIRAATGDYLFFMDCDIALLPDTMAVHERRAAPRRLLAGSCVLLDEAAAQNLMRASPAPSAADWERAWSQADHAKIATESAAYAHHARLRRWHLARPHKPKLLSGHFSLFSDDVWRVNGFDEHYVGWGYEDDDLARRLYLDGVRPFGVIGEARALHIWHPSLAPQKLAHHRERPNRRYFRRWFIPARCASGLR